MRRENRKSDRNTQDNFKSILYIGGSVLALATIVFIITFVIYGNKVSNEAKTSKLNSEQIIGLVPNETNNTTTEQASNPIGKTVNESKNELNTTVQNTMTNSTTNNNTQTQNPVKTDEPKKTEEVKKDPSFAKPVEGETIKEFATDKVVYSNTLKEWTTHNGIDIKADKTTVVKAATDGKVKSIKNDPRSGLTIVLEHENGFTSVYSNLLTSEFVVVGEEVKQGQTIATVGNTAAFEIADECHLHFEILKDNQQLNPAIYIH